MSKWVENAAHILASPFNSTSRQCHEVLASQYPFLQNFKDSVSPSEACLYDHTNWSLLQAQQQSSLGFPQCATSVRGDRTKPRACFFCLTYKCGLWHSLCRGSVAKKPHSDHRMECHQEWQEVHSWWCISQCH